MPKENASVCEYAMVAELPKSRNGGLTPRKLPIKIPKSKGSKSNGQSAKKHQDDSRSKSRSSETGSSSSVMEQARPATKSSKHEKRLNHSRRTISADRAESHYTYIDSGSSILGGAIRENAIPEALYATIPETLYARANETGNSQLNAQSRSQPVYAIPSMVSPPPTYDVAISETCQSDLLPTYDEYLCYKDVIRSHTPPPPWSDSTTHHTTRTPSGQTRRDLLPSDPEFREYVAQFSLSQNNERSTGHHHHYQGAVLRDNSSNSNQQTSREQQQQVRIQQRPRAMPPRSQSESRVQQQRMSTKYEDVAFCMETTTALHWALENGTTLCNLM